MIHGWRAEVAFAPLDSGERGEEISRRLRRAIELGILEDGTQLPSEAELATHMRVSTLTLRSALADLRRQGLLETRRGRGGGSFVKSADLTQAGVQELATFSLEALRDLRDYRALLAGSAAAAAAARPYNAALTRLESMGTAIQSATDAATLTRADSRFHVELAAASRSVRLLKQEMSVQAEIGTLLWMLEASGRDPADVAAQHAAIIGAVGEGDAERAREAAEQHARDDVNHLIELRMQLDRDMLLRGQGEHRPMSQDRVVESLARLGTQFSRAAHTTVETIESAVLTRMSTSRQTSLEELNGIHELAAKLITASDGTIWGAGFVTDAAHFGTPALLWSYRPTTSAVERLVIDPDFYNYTTAPWWPGPCDDRSVRVTGAYVDASGTNEYIVTFCKRVDMDDTMIGAAAADVQVSQIQARFQPLLLALPQGSCITDQHGTVIATNTGRLLGGTYPPKGTSSVPVVLPDVPWLLHIGDD